MAKDLRVKSYLMMERPLNFPLSWPRLKTDNNFCLESLLGNLTNPSKLQKQMKVQADTGWISTTTFEEINCFKDLVSGPLQGGRENITNESLYIQRPNT